MNPIPLPWMFAIIGAMLIVGLIAGGYCGWELRAARVPGELADQKTSDKTACATAQQLTKGANDDIQKSDAYIAGRLSALSLQHSAACVRVSSRAKLPASGPQPSGHDGAGINSDWLRSYAATAEGYRSQLDICTKFLTQERALPQP